ncbi:metal-binding protein [Synechococcus sp. CC9616]|uniref:metal-binding protein n=1 Tax=Synechococcus sp. CC9616 TaxID=110663 RepID=UPI000490FBE2|nr:metal-binding protein [Synechococcus sp. CC9616]
MASGRDHDRATCLSCLPFGLLLGVLLGHWCGLIGAVAFFVGGLWLSPDLDTHSNALRRWGPLAFLWWPYRRLLRHRSVWSHGPLLGTIGRLSLLTAWLWCLLAVIPGADWNTFWSSAIQWFNAQPQQAVAMLVGLEASVWLHLILDGDPLPVEWNRSRRQ